MVVLLVMNACAGLVVEDVEDEEAAASPEESSVGQLQGTLTPEADAATTQPTQSATTKPLGGSALVEYAATSLTCMDSVSMAATLKPAFGATSFHIERVVYRWAGASEPTEVSLFLPQQFTEASSLRAEHDKALALSIPRFGNEAEVTVTFQGLSDAGEAVDIEFPSPVDSSAKQAATAAKYLAGTTSSELIDTMLARQSDSASYETTKQEEAP